MKKPFLIITDSSCTINREYALENDIVILPLSIIRSDGKVFLDNGKETSPGAVFSELDNGYTYSTSCTPLGLMHDLIENKIQEYEKIIFIGISGGFSSQYNHMKNISKDYPDRLFVYDTENFGYALEDLIYSLKELLKTNPSDEEIANLCLNHHYYTSNFLCPKNVKGLVASGRIPKFVGGIMNIIHLVPVIKSEYKNHNAGVVAGIKKAPRKIMDLVSNVYGGLLDKSHIKKVCVLHAGLEDYEIEALKNEVKLRFLIEDNQIEVRMAPCIFLVYVWKGAIGYQFITDIKKVHYSKVPNHNIH
ncbi:DegV family protein [Ureaplasma canigenitalium]|uniref:DegV family protein n=1 Tax=Ureaplasma canigenitalium TaxID=42092 RepID=UPI0004E0B0B4|nr:DegV family protein [Ureaplasma canigenitalium]